MRSSVLEEESALAKRTGRCLGCDGKTKWWPQAKHYSALCGDPECKQVYQALYYESVLRRKREVQRAANKVVKKFEKKKLDAVETWLRSLQK